MGRGMAEERYYEIFPYDDRGGYDPDFEKHKPGFAKAFYEGRVHEYEEKEKDYVAKKRKAKRDKAFERKFGKHQIQSQDTQELNILIKLEGKKITEQQYCILVFLFPAFLNSYEENGGFQPGLLRESLLEKVDLPDDERKICYLKSKRRSKKTGLETWWKDPKKRTKRCLAVRQ